MHWTQLIALQLQAKLPMYIHVLPNILLTYLRFISVSTAINNSLAAPDLLRLAQDLTVTPASHSQAYCEQISIRGELTARRRNQLIMTLYTTLFL